MNKFIIWCKIFLIVTIVGAIFGQNGQQTGRGFDGNLYHNSGRDLGRPNDQRETNQNTQGRYMNPYLLEERPNSRNSIGTFNQGNGVPTVNRQEFGTNSDLSNQQDVQRGISGYGDRVQNNNQKTNEDLQRHYGSTPAPNESGRFGNNQNDRNQWNSQYYNNDNLKRSQIPLGNNNVDQNSRLGSNPQNQNSEGTNLRFGSGHQTQGYAASLPGGHNNQNLRHSSGTRNQRIQTSLPGFHSRNSAGSASDVIPKTQSSSVYSEPPRRQNTPNYNENRGQGSQYHSSQGSSTGQQGVHTRLPGFHSKNAPSSGNYNTRT